MTSDEFGELKMSLSARVAGLVRRSVLPHVIMTAAILINTEIIGSFFTMEVVAILLPSIIVFVVTSASLCVMAFVSKKTKVNNSLFMSLLVCFYISSSLVLASFPVMALYLLIPLLVVYGMIGIQGVVKPGHVLYAGEHTAYWLLLMVTIMAPTAGLIFTAGRQILAVTATMGIEIFIVFIIAVLTFPIWLGGTFLHAVNDILYVLKEGTWIDGFKVASFNAATILIEVIK